MIGTLCRRHLPFMVASVLQNPSIHSHCQPQKAHRSCTQEQYRGQRCDYCFCKGTVTVVRVVLFLPKKCGDLVFQVSYRKLNLIYIYIYRPRISEPIYIHLEPKWGPRPFWLELRPCCCFLGEAKDLQKLVVELNIQPIQWSQEKQLRWISMLWRPSAHGSRDIYYQQILLKVFQIKWSTKWENSISTCDYVIICYFALFVAISNLFLL